MKFLVAISIILFVSCNQQEKEIYNYTFNINSEILGENRPIDVKLPESLVNEISGEKKYPVIYVLDGEDMFQLTCGIATFLSSKKGNSHLPESIIVGIQNTNRNKDLTPTRISGIDDSGAGPAFLKFISEELIPFVENKYPTFKHRTLIGHSFGGLFALNTLYESPELFDNYLAIDPSYIYLENREMNFEEKHSSNKNLFLGIANTFIPDSISMSNRTSQFSNQHFLELKKYSDKLTNVNELLLNFSSKFYPNDDHASICVPAINDGLRSLFSWYHSDFSLLHNPDNLTRSNIFDLLEKSSIAYSKEFKEKVPPDQGLVNRIAIHTKDMSLKKELYEINYQNFPKSFNTNYSLGQYYEKYESIDSALKFYERALEIYNEQNLRIKFNTMVNSR